MPTAKVLDIITVSTALREAVPALPFTGEGVLVILDANDLSTTQLSNAVGQAATITRPDGSVIERPISGAEVRHGATALYFQGVGQSAIPRLARIDW